MAAMYAVLSAVLAPKAVKTKSNDGGSKAVQLVDSLLHCTGFFAQRETIIRGTPSIRADWGHPRMPECFCLWASYAAVAAVVARRCALP